MAARMAFDSRYPCDADPGFTVHIGQVGPHKIGLIRLWKGIGKNQYRSKYLLNTLSDKVWDVGLTLFRLVIGLDFDVHLLSLPLAGGGVDVDAVLGLGFETGKFCPCFSWICDLGCSLSFFT